MISKETFYGGCQFYTLTANTDMPFTAARVIILTTTSAYDWKLYDPANLPIWKLPVYAWIFNRGTATITVRNKYGDNMKNLAADRGALFVVGINIFDEIAWFADGAMTLGYAGSPL
jgi:hypothetical protein